MIWSGGESWMLHPGDQEGRGVMSSMLVPSRLNEGGFSDDRAGIERAWRRRGSIFSMRDGERGFRGRGAEDEEQFLLEVADELQDTRSRSTSR